jgi:hypothetical protein
MSLNPLRGGLVRSGLEAFSKETPFRAEADAALAGFRAARADLERQVRRGDLTPKVARERAAAAAQALREGLARKAESYSPIPRAFLDRLVEADAARKRSRENQSLEGLQRETIRLMRQMLLEQQLVNRVAEFEGRAFVRSIHGGVPAPTLDSLLDFHTQAARAGDDAAAEWARRQLEAMRPRVLSDDDRHKIDLACDRPDRVNPRLVARYAEALRDRSAEEREQFVAQAVGSRDASACAAAFVLAREAPEGGSARWVRAVLEGLKDFPDATLSTLREWEADARRAEADAARSAAEYASALAEADARIPGLVAPTEAELRRQAGLDARPLARPDEPIGLGLARRGWRPDDVVPPDAPGIADDPADDGHGY